MGWKKFIIIPLITEISVIGALIGISRTAYVERESVGILEHFASQAALAIESAYLFDELRQKNIKLIEANRVKSEFLAIMSHELRTPMHAILGFSELLSDGEMGEITTDQKAALREIHNNACNLSELINNILDLAKAEAGKMDIVRSEFNFEETAEQVAYTLSPLLKEKNQQFSLESDPQHAYLLTADESKLRQILTNILSNAIKFTPERGKIAVAITVMSREQLPLEWSDTESALSEFLFVEISDTGIGIPRESQKDLFQPFKQIDPSFTRRYQGTGLGLALCKEFVELHGGRIGVESDAGQGSRFFFFIPLLRPKLEA